MIDTIKIFWWRDIENWLNKVDNKNIFYFEHFNDIIENDNNFGLKKDLNQNMNKLCFFVRFN